ncbi:hypothetical protein [Variovorax sp. CF313]|uniref:hypothetical protein n=1 Tax=Variovorax sp. CF313 TaxID=1144315 RepID=UPI0012FB92B2|nr:hypothetical protein [Variovorax sp. CF313]
MSKRPYLLRYDNEKTLNFSVLVNVWPRIQQRSDVHYPAVLSVAGAQTQSVTRSGVCLPN